MNWLERNMFGELNWLCYLFGHRWVFIGKYPYTAVCGRCELNHSKLKETIGEEK